jgi:hypothetical protein
MYKNTGLNIGGIGLLEYYTNAVKLWKQEFFLPGDADMMWQVYCQQKLLDTKCKLEQASQDLWLLIKVYGVRSLTTATALFIKL